MSLNALKDSVKDYVDKKTELEKEKQSFSEEYNQVDILVAISAHLDNNVVTAMKDVQHELDQKRELLDQETDALQDYRNDLEHKINEEQAKIEAADRKIKGLLGKKYTGSLEDASRKCDALMTELDEMLKAIDGQGISGGGIAASWDASMNIKGVFLRLPPERRTAVYELFENAPSEIKNLTHMLRNKLVVESTTGGDCCHYDTRAKVIRMEPQMDDQEYAEVFSHEYGHFVDDNKGNVSFSSDFRRSLQSDLVKYDRNTPAGRQLFDSMLDDLMASDAAYDRAVSDVLSAFFVNDPEVVDRYHWEGIPYYRHKDAYWAHRGNREAEIYANAFSILSQDNQDSCQFMQKYFPETWDQFKKTL